MRGLGATGTGSPARPCRAARPSRSSRAASRRPRAAGAASAAAWAARCAAGTRSRGRRTPSLRRANIGSTQRTASSQTARFSSMPRSNGSELGDAGALADAELDAAVAHQVERGHALRDARRVVGGELDDAVAEPDVLGALAGGAEEHFRRRGVRVLLEEVVLHLPGVVVAEPVRELELRQRVLVEIALAARAPGLRKLEFDRRRRPHVTTSRAPCPRAASPVLAGPSPEKALRLAPGVKDRRADRITHKDGPWAGGGPWSQFPDRAMRALALSQKRDPKWKGGVSWTDAADLLRPPPVSARGHRHAVSLYVRFTLSFRDVEDLLAERRLDLSYGTVRRWVLKFGPAIAGRLRRGRARPTGHWHLDEVAVRIAGEQRFLWRAVDGEGEVLDVLVQRRRDEAAARRLMRKLVWGVPVSSMFHMTYCPCCQ